ncbi:MAG: hypothetical protein F2663_06340 [Actinobacteria bacterium]|uniref:Unannotated protein n=1 Tax=freshwater metagenome TaxID=449393 RepID=A0A6J6PVP3_9ZZZZ|nr:hypothetical protein [Actinomycetota bacterium]
MQQKRGAVVVVVTALMLAVLAAAASAQAREREPWESSPDAALYIVDHHGKPAQRIQLLLPYARAMAWILEHCKTTAGHVADLAIDNADQASEIAGKRITTLQMLNAYASNAPKVRGNCTQRFALAEARLE